jgi:hypothetical protein
MVTFPVIAIEDFLPPMAAHYSGLLFARFAASGSKARKQQTLANCPRQ